MFTVDYATNQEERKLWIQTSSNSPNFNILFNRHHDKVIG